jgi:outer membrane protein
VDPKPINKGTKEFYCFSFFFVFLLWPNLGIASEKFNIELSVGIWNQSPSGFVSYQSDDRIDLENVLNYGPENRFTGRLKVETPRLWPNVYLMASPMKFEETSVTDQFYDFGDIVIIPGIEFFSKLVLNQFDLGLYYHLPLAENKQLKGVIFDLGFNLRIVDGEALVIQESLIRGVKLKDSKKETTFIPMLFLGIGFQPVERFFIEGEFRGIADSDSDIYSLIGRLKFNIYKSYFISGGYRYDYGKSDVFDFKFDTDFSGPMVELGVKF